MAPPRNLLLLTATVQPRAGQPSLTVLHPGRRLAEYEAALAFYSRLLDDGAIDGIVFAENSGFPLARLAAKFPHPAIEWLAVPPADHPLHYHRGYAEFRLIDDAVRSSRLVQAAGDALRLWKVSGRYEVRNLARVVRWAPRRFDLYGDFRDGWAEMSMLAWSRRAHDVLMGRVWERFATDVPPETILAAELRTPGVAALRIVRSFAWPPFIVGRRGSDGSPYQGRWTRYRFALQCAAKFAALPLRRLSLS